MKLFVLLIIPCMSLTAFAGRDWKCERMKGKCQYTTTSRCDDGSYVSGKCWGPSTRKCCVPKTKCSLARFSSRKVLGLSGKKILIDPNFTSSMRKIEAAAVKCGVKVYVTSSFRKKSQRVTGAIVVPARKSNHLVAHAIDINLMTRAGWCNSSCLQKRRNPHAKCFIDAVRRSGLRWGGDFSKKDPVHIDDGLNVRDGRRWAALYRQFQANC